MSEKWYVYILECHDNSLYTGITNNLEERVKTHNQGERCKIYSRSIAGEIVEILGVSHQIRSPERRVQNKETFPNKKVKVSLIKEFDWKPLV